LFAQGVSVIEQPILSTARLILRPFSLADARDVQRLAGAYEIASTTAVIPHPYEDGMAEAWIGTHPAQLADGTGLVYAITLRATQDLCGAIGLTIKPAHRRAEMGYWIGVPFWGQGYCTEAAAALRDHAFRALGLHRLVAVHMARNPASGRVMQKIGMRHEGVLRQHELRWGAFETIECYGLLRSEWEAETGA
jgi:RimJ/RimL family protein N-acetyltransferase